MSLPTFGSYRPLRLIARGGTSDIYLVESDEEHRKFAIKVVRETEGVRPAFLERESEILATLSGELPAIPRLVESRTDASPPWFVMEYVEGRSLDLVLSALEDDPEGPETEHTEPIHSGPSLATTRSSQQQTKASTMGFSAQFQLIRELVRVVSQLHQRGVVHGDLAPSNIVIRQSDNQLFLVDFGSALREHRGATAREPTYEALPVFATRGYVAPEVLAGATPDRRSDVYALGCLCLRILTGRLPHHGEFAPASDPRAAPYIEPLTRLLDRRPSLRIPALLDLQHALDTKEGSERSSPSWSLGRPRLVGRRSTLDYVKSRIADLPSGTGKIMLLAGEAGIGKTRLLNEVTSAAVHRNCQVILATCQDDDARSMHGVTRPAILEAVRSWVHQSGIKTSPRLQDALEKGLREEHHEGHGRARLLADLRQLFCVESKKKPLLIAIDDLHWADEFTTGLITNERSLDLCAHPILLLGLARTDHTSQLPVIRSARGELLQLGRLIPSEVYHLVDDMLGGLPFPERLADWLFKRTDGNPLFVCEYLRELVVNETLVRRRNESGWSIEWKLEESDEPAPFLPKTIAQMVEARVSRLNEETRHLAKIAAYLGSQFERDELMHLDRSLLQVPDLDVGLTQLINTNVIERTGASRFRFTHQMFHQHCLAMGSVEENQRIQRDLASHYERKGIDSPGALLRLGSLWSGAAQPQRAVPLLLEFVELKNEDPSPETLRQAYRRLLAEFAKLDLASRRKWQRTMFDVRVRYADLLHKSAQFEAAVALYREASEGELDQLARATLLRKQCRSLMSARSYQEADRICAQALQMHREAEGRDTPQWWGEHIELQLTKFWLDYYSGAKPRSIEDIEQAVNEHGTVVQKCSLYHCASAWRTQSAQFRHTEQSVKYARRALELVRSNPALEPELALAQLNLAFPLLWSQDEEKWRRACELLEEAEQEATWADNIPVLSRIQTYLGVAYRRRQMIEATARQAEAAMFTARRAQSPGYVGAAWANKAWIELKGGNLRRAQFFGRTAREQWRGGRLRFPFQFLLNFTLIECLRIEENFEEARELAQELLAKDLHRLPEELCALIRQLDGENSPEARQQDAQLLAVSNAAKKLGYA